MNQFRKLVFFFLFLISFSSYATSNDIDNYNPNNTQTVLDKRTSKENSVKNNVFSIIPYKQNYLLPYYYTASPYNAVYINQTPNNEKLNNSEVKFQLSFQIPIWQITKATSLSFAYTQLSYWQLYNKNAFFRSTDYEPEIFIDTNFDWHLMGDWYFDAVKVGAVHQSNGFGDSLERSWNRIFLEASIANKNIMIRIRPWLVLQDKTYREYNPNLSKFMGYGELTFAYKINNQVITLQTHGLVEHKGHYATAVASYSFPLTTHLHGFLQVFSGYGQSLLEYNHRTNSFGLGVQLNDFI